MCGIVGIYSHESVAVELYDSLIHLQHRGQDAAGILTCDERFYVKHGLGLVKEIFSVPDMQQLHGNIGIGHSRYPTAGGYRLEDTQPMWIGSPRGIALAHNGNLVNHHELAKEITREKHRHLNSTTDSEVLLHLLAEGFEQLGYSNDEDDEFFTMLCQAVKTIFARAQGSYSAVSTIIGKGLVAFRDPHGIRPLVWGERECYPGKKDYIFASETTMFYSLEFQHKGDVQPGEVVFVNRNGKMYRRVLEQKTFTPCIFEYVYFARPDAKLNNINVYHARERMGHYLAKRWQEKYPKQMPDVVIPAPFTSNTAAMAFANTLGIRYAEGLYKNPFIGRTFIMPNQQDRSRHVRYKLTPQRAEIENKKVIIIDDSIVRGTTSREIVKMVREYGAQEIYFASACPPIKYPCFYGIDMPSRHELIAAQQTEEEIRRYLGADVLLYQDVSDLVEAVAGDSGEAMRSPCMACMNGEYISGNIDMAKMQEQEKMRERNAT
ncbi:MAG: amidophosphoribosyltransferase [Gammaproteobacteria bacterium RIFCSPHIGHO2_12_FULL_45_9]|nr:MAG: amidophosphoribosyltransferase [Gammaproteobacteria bacterium RIFCSPHIGHO2_12_FULL_45_9]